MNESQENPYRSPAEPGAGGLERLKEFVRKDRTALYQLIGVAIMAFALATSLAEGRTGVTVYGYGVVMLLLLIDVGRRYKRGPSPPAE